MSGYIISEGTPTAWGGRTVRIVEANYTQPLSSRSVTNYPERLVTPRRSSAHRNKLIQGRYLDGRTAAELAREFNLAEASIYYILHAMGTQMRPPGRRAV